MKYYGIYKITNKVNDKMYIGQHITDDVDDGYMGSGAIMKKALKKYGEEAFTKEWLEFAENAEDLNYLERMYVDEEWLARPDTYNLVLGGGGCHMLQHTEETRKKLSIASKGQNNGMYGKRHTEETRKKLSARRLGKPSWNSGKRGLQTAWNKGQSWSETTRKKLSEAHRGRHFYNNGVVEVVCFECPEGFRPGRLHKQM